MNSKYQDVLREWLAPLIPANAHWFNRYRASDHGFGAQTFHQKCDANGGIGPSVTLVKVGRFVFGGFSDKRWGGM